MKNENIYATEIRMIPITGEDDIIILTLSRKFIARTCAMEEEHSFVTEISRWFRVRGIKQVGKGYSTVLLVQNHYGS